MLLIFAPPLAPSLHQAAARERKHARQLKSWADTIKHEEALESWEQQQQRDRESWAAEQLARARAVDVRHFPGQNSPF